MNKTKNWKELNAAITDGSLYTASSRKLRRWYQAAVDQRDPYLTERIQKLIAEREGRAQGRWTAVGAIGTIIALIVSLLLYFISR